MAFITPKPYPLYDVRNRTDWRIPVPVEDSNGDAFDFTNWQAFAQVRTKSSGTLIVDFNTYDATIIFEGGTMFLIRDKDDTDIKKDEYVWDCKFLNTEGILAGNIKESIFQITGGPTE